MKKIYVASSWRNHYQQNVVYELRQYGFDVYDFKEPKPGDKGFGWHEIDPNWKSWSAEEFKEALDHPMAQIGFKSDMDALRSCDVCVLVLPCGRSAHLELGWATGNGKRTAILLDNPISEPELMYKMVDVVAYSLDEIIEDLRKP